MMLQKHIFMLAEELGLTTSGSSRDFPYDQLPQRIRDLYDESQERMRRLHTGGTVTSEILDSLIRQYELERNLCNAGAPFLVRTDYHWPEEEAAEDAAWEPAADDADEGGVAVATKKKSKKA